MKKLSLRDRRRQETREALWRAVERRDRQLDKLARTHLHIKTLKRTLARLDAPAGDVISKQPLSVAEGKLLDVDTLKLVNKMYRELSDDIPDLSGGRR